MSSEARFVGLDAGRDGIEAWVRPTGEVWKMDAGEDGMTQSRRNALANFILSLSSCRPTAILNCQWPGFSSRSGCPLRWSSPATFAISPELSAEAAGPSKDRPDSWLSSRNWFSPMPTPLPEEQVEELRQLRGRRLEIIQMMAAERSRAAKALPALEKEIQAHIQFLERSLASIDGQFSRKVRASRIWH